MKENKNIIILMLVVVAFMLGFFIGQKSVLNRQKVYQRNNEYIVVFEGHEYIYE